MEYMETLPQIRTALMDKVRVLRELSDQAYSIEIQIKRIAGRISDLENGKLSREIPETNKEKSNIIPFPGSDKRQKIRPGRTHGMGPDLKNSFMVPVQARPGEPLPDSIPDFRPMLQRDGLILLSWDKKRTEKGEIYRAYWVTSNGIFRYFASAPMSRDDFASARPDHKSYAAEDGVEFYGEISPCYVVHVAPELMMNFRGDTDERPCHIEKLKKLGVKSDFEYKFLLTREKIKLRGKDRNHEAEKTGA